MASGWSVLRTTGDEPEPRGGHTALLVEKNLLLMGGSQHQGQGKFKYFSLDPHVLNTETLQWFKPRVALGKGPAARCYHTVTRVGSSLFIFGGQTEKQKGSSSVLGDMPVFDLVRMTWETRDARGKQPRPRYWHTASLVNGKIFIAGGHSGSHSLSDVHVLDTQALTWSQPELMGFPLPSLASHTATIVGERLYFLGGMSVTLDDEGASSIEYGDDVHVLDCETMTMERLRRRGTQPAGRAYHQATLVGGYLLVLGGWSGKAHGLDELSTLDLEGLGSWYSVQVPGQAPPAVYGHSATLIGSKVVMFGGWDGVSPLNSIHVLDTTLL
jgi:N-acetylneuraminic acid mutarotase